MKKVSYIYGYAGSKPEDWENLTPERRFPFVDSMHRHGRLHGHVKPETAIKAARRLGIVGQFTMTHSEVHTGARPGSARVRVFGLEA